MYPFLLASLLAGLPAFSLPKTLAAALRMAAETQVRLEGAEVLSAQFKAHLALARPKVEAFVTLAFRPQSSPNRDRRQVATIGTLAGAEHHTGRVHPSITAATENASGTQCCQPPRRGALPVREASNRGATE